MRQSAIALAALAAGLLPLAARAQETQDRYGAPRLQAEGGATLRGAQRQTALLSWTGKAQALRGAEGDAEGLRGSAPLDTATGLAVRNANLGRLKPASATRHSPPASPRRIAFADPPAAAQSPRLPTSLYDQGGADPTPRSQDGQASAAPPQGQPQAQAQGGAHYYSLVREYGLTPDPIAHTDPSVLALSPTVAQAMADNKDTDPPIDLAGQDQANVAPPPRQTNQGTSSTSSSSSSGQTTSTYTFKQ